MAFDRNDPADLAALKTEVVTNPRGATGLGDPAGPGQAILDALNLAENNPTPETGKPPLLAREVWLIRSTALLGAEQEQIISDLFRLVDGLDADISEFHAAIAEQDNELKTALDNRPVQISIAQSLFADQLYPDPTHGHITEPVTLTLSDWHAARDS